MAVAADDWYQRRRNDPTGKYFRYVVGQVRPRRDNRATFQGIYAFTPPGQLLANTGSGKKIESTLRMLQRALREWERLPPGNTEPGAFRLPDLPDEVWDRQYAPEPPAGALVLRVFTRALSRDDESRELSHWEPASAAPRRGTQTAFDHMWLRDTELQELIDLCERHDRFSVPAEMAYRLARFHLVDNTRGEPDHWRLAEVRHLRFLADVTHRDAKRTRIRLMGEFALATDADLVTADRGYTGRLQGDVLLENGRVTKLRIGALGDHWGEGRYTPGAREGRQPVAVIFREADGTEAGDLVPPQAARSLERYFNASTHAR